MADGDENDEYAGNGEPAWPSDDRDAASGPPGNSERLTNELPVPKVTAAEQPTLWVRKPDPAPPAQPARPQWQPRPAQPRRPPAPARPPAQAPPGPPSNQPNQPNPASQPNQRPRVEIRPASGHAQPMRIEPTGEQRPAPARPPEPAPPPRQAPRQPAQQQQPQQQPTQVQQQSAQPAEPEPAPPAEPRRRRRGPVLGGLALLLVVAVGVVLALPDVSNRLGLPWAPNAPQGDPPEPIAVTRDLSGPSAAAPAPTPAGVAAVLDPLATDPALGTFGGSVIDPASGTVLWERDASRPFTPASTVKLLTAAAALLSLDHGRQLPTTVVEGPEPGSVTLVAGGDVTLSSLPEGQNSVYPGAAHLDQLVAEVKQATGGDVSEVRLDLGAFSGPVTGEGWDPGDAPSTFAAEVQPAMLDGGRSDPTDEHSMRVADPAGELARELADRLGAEVADPVTTSAPEDARVLGEVHSAPVTELVDQLLLSSDNLLAEAVARQVAIAEGAEPSFAGAAQATLDVLSRNGFDVSGVQLADASGLSTKDKASAAALNEVLAVAAAPGGDDPRTAKLRPMLGGLPVAGGSGTLSSRYTEPPAAEGRGWVRAKTGTIPASGVNSLAGLVVDADGRVLVFSLMSSGSQTEAGRAALDAMPAALRGCGCR
ncbi:D-alanyl-D-alanine carboxypeptidase/D-alanyl-D-alanine endopeptidase [Qaidamihabitans albus]|uniref:D-alanyl-D-alanine carboxypeptidase/D-alanyl-D-alanine endopeptidase n=1 Tax=Qaidamihabitans albus TaxID=2795733 RepID=UPI0027DB1F6C|nr:D-alanyl-D-alanine carboxypeptidase/D-alanyl-D-alanine-endopeptidase [Qaidamihabitans albus]